MGGAAVIIALLCSNPSLQSITVPTVTCRRLYYKAACVQPGAANLMTSWPTGNKTCTEECCSSGWQTREVHAQAAFTCTMECLISKREAWFMPQRSATRIIRRRFLPASLGVMSATLQPAVGTVQQAAVLTGRVEGKGC